MEGSSERRRRPESGNPVNGIKKMVKVSAFALHLRIMGREITDVWKILFFAWQNYQRHSSIWKCISSDYGFIFLRRPPCRASWQQSDDSQLFFFHRRFLIVVSGLLSAALLSSCECAIARPTPTLVRSFDRKHMCLYERIRSRQVH